MEIQQFHYDNKIVQKFLYATLLWGVVGMLVEPCAVLGRPRPDQECPQAYAVGIR